MPRGMLEPLRDEVIEDWRKFHKEELHNFYLSQITIKMIIQEGEIRRDSKKYAKQ
jgi:hypothetical protein